MCSIFGSPDVNEFNDLAKLNQPRGRHNWSITIFRKDQSILQSLQGPGQAPSIEAITGAAYYLGHVQTPTGTANNAHPAVDKLGRKLWHNGILLETFTGKVDWDTQFLLDYLTFGQLPDKLSQVKGSFSCVLWNPGPALLLFRNDNAPMYYKDSTISSVKFKDSKMTDPNTIFWLHFEQGLDPLDVFTNADPYVC